MRLILKISINHYRILAVECLTTKKPNNNLSSIYISFKVVAHTLFYNLK